MLNLIVIDDEPIIVDGLYELFQEIRDVELTIYKAYSAVEALETIRRNKMDIVITDIEMPEMTGLQLQELIVSQWPACRIIFLTGYSDFSYVQSAVRNGAADFILKTEGDEKIIAAFYKAAHSVSRELDAEQLLEKAKRQMQLARPALQREYLLHLVQSDVPEKDHVRRQRFEELAIGLHPERPVLLVLGRVDNWHADMSGPDKALLLYAVQNISEEYLSRCRVAFASYSVNKFVMLVQPVPPEQPGDRAEPAAGGREDPLYMFVSGMLDNIQAACKKYLKISVSFAVGQRPADWAEAGRRWMELELLLGRGLGLGQEVILTERREPAAEARLAHSEETEQKLYRLLKRIDRAEAALENGHQEPFFEWLDEVLQTVAAETPFNPLQTEAYYASAQLLLRTFNRAGAYPDGWRAEQLDRLMNIRYHADWREASAHLHRTASLIFEKKQQERTDRSDELVEKINRFIHEHLDKDLSLNRLSEKVYMNPSYLSRLYKQLTGTGISEFILEVRMEKAKELLKLSRHKVQDISRMTGFETPAYFTRLFKKYTGLTPQEYRELHTEVGL
ncbi:response regulator [Paenibacillus hamazuiensis]|uniref:response regulator n=1 Tax=Paenibacillus hamazuiensis TaxID=2936508 RepID=UPI0020106E19|nr:response regulator [Paenibacillus hamazuiensis]